MNIDDADPDYMVFLDHLREDGNSYILEMVDELHGSLRIIKYEGEDEVPKESELTTEETSDPFSNKIDRSNEKAHANGLSSPESAPNVPLVSGRLFKEDSSIDGDYQQFLHHVRLEDGCMVLEWNSGNSVRYEEKGSSAASQGLSSESNLRSSGQELIPYRSSPQHSDSDIEMHEEDGRFIMPCRSNDSFNYKEKLLEVLSKPYDHNEYEELLKKVSEHKPLTRQKHLRSMSITYATNKEGLSYLDHHPDLAKQIEGADCRTALALLRGFFFWLKHLSHEGAYMPWVSKPARSEILFTGGYEISLPIDCTIDF